MSLNYVGRLMNRSFPDTLRLRRVLQCIWHQINNGQDIFVVGQILDDDTVKGGTGWGAEFAKLCNKQPAVFDQEVNGWFRWTGQSWEPEAEPVIRQVAIAGGGTRVLKDNGLAAINDLFDRSFGRLIRVRPRALSRVLCVIALLSSFARQTTHHRPQHISPRLPATGFVAGSTCEHLRLPRR